MCGIVGFYDTSKTSSRDQLVSLTDLLKHRGPDVGGYNFMGTSQGFVGLGHRRLSIIDLSPLGHQPMVYKELSMVYNGEVYNFREIQTELGKLGYNFDSTSDSEVILKAFHCWGISAVSRFNGMFAIAFYDKIKDELFLIRDRLGVKPLYYYFEDGNLFFSSELKPIMAAPFLKKQNIDKKALNSFLFHGYINAPHTIFNNVYKLEAGHYLVYRKMKIDITEYWSIENVYTRREVNYSLSEEQTIDKIDELLNDSIKHRMISDVSIGSFLSGGIDSTLVSAIMQKLSPDPINTFTIGFNEAKFNEATHARNVANFLKTNHHEEYFPIDAAQSFITSLPEFYDEPFADSSQLPTMMVSELARKNVTVVLTGDGGDEVFCGYTRYDEAANLERYKNLGKILSPLKSINGFEALLNRINTKLPKLFYMDSQSSIINKGYLSSAFFLAGLVKESDFDIDKKFVDILKLSPKNIQQAYMLQDILLYLPDDILTKVDRATMSVGLEGREPLLDYRLIELSFNIPHELKHKDNEGKYLLKKLVSRYVPKKIMDRPKMGFGVPVYDWIHEGLRHLIDKYISPDFIEQQNIFDPAKMSGLIALFHRQKNNAFISAMVWNILVFQLWFEKFRLHIK